MTRYLQDWEGITPSGTTPTNGNSGTAPATAFDTAVISIGAGSTLTSSNAQAVNGTLSGAVTAAATEAAYCGWSTAIGTLTELWGRMSIYFTANPASTARIFAAHNSGTLSGAVQIGTNGKLNILDTGGTSLTIQENGLTQSTNTIALNQWNRIEWHVLCSATVGMVQAKLFQTVTSGSPTETCSSDSLRNTGTQATTYRFGRAASGSGAPGTYYIEDLAIDTAGYPGPYTVAGTTPSLLGQTIRRATRHVAVREFNR